MSSSVLAEQASKADYTAATQILCQLAVLNASTAWKEAALEMCETQVVDTAFLNITYPDILEKQVCKVPEVLPCLPAWSEQRYTQQSWYPAPRCSPAGHAPPLVSGSPEPAVPYMVGMRYT